MGVDAINLKPIQVVLDKVDLKATGKNVAGVLQRLTVKDVADGKLSQDDLLRAAKKLAAEQTTSGVKPTQSLEKAVSALPATLSRYRLEFDPKNDPKTLSIRPAIQIQPWMRTAAKSASPASLSGFGDLQLTDAAGHVKKMLNGKVLTNRSLEQLFAHKDMDLAALKKAGFNLTSPRAVLAITIEGSADPIFVVFRDKQSFKDVEKNVGKDGAMKDASRAVAILKTHCNATIGELSHGMVAKKPVIYLYPESKTNVRVSVKIKGEFIAQYPETKNGTWNMVATPDGVLFDPKTEKRYSYLFWEGTNPASFSIDRDQAFCVKSKDVESFLENACTKLGLNDRERTDFISYWIGPMKRNPISLVQFLSTEDYEQYAELTIEPKPDSVIRMFMLFQRITDVVKTGNPELATMKRHRFTAVEWGGTNLDER